MTPTAMLEPTTEMVTLDSIKQRFPGVFAELIEKDEVGADELNAVLELESLNRAVELVVESSGADYGTASAFVATFVAATMHWHREHSCAWHPWEAWMQAFHDAVLEPLIPDNEDSTTGSAHEAIETLCSEIAGPVTLHHSKDTSHPQGRYCYAIISASAG